MRYLGALLLLRLTTAGGDSYHLGDCPLVPQVEEFDMNQFLGVWYGVEKTGNEGECLMYEFRRADEEGTYRVEEIWERRLVRLPSIGALSGVRRNNGVLTVKPGSSLLVGSRFPSNLLGSSDFTVFDTDYDSYAGLFLCQKLPLSNRRTAVVLSRTTGIDDKILKQIKDRLRSHGVEPGDMKPVRHDECHRQPSLIPGDIK